MSALAEPPAQHALVAGAAGHVDEREVAPSAAVGPGIGFDVGVETVGQLDRDRTVFGRHQPVLRHDGSPADPQHDARHSLIEALQWEVAERALALGTSVILDFGFWAREEREEYRLRAKDLGASSEVHFLDVPKEELLRRLAVRNSQPSQVSFHISEESMKSWIEFFQRPTPDELERRE